MSPSTGTRRRAPDVACPFGEGLSDRERSAIEAWWRTLPLRDRRRLRAASDPRAESPRHQGVPRRDGTSAFHDLPLRVKGIWVSPGDRSALEEEDAFPWDLYEYLVGHEMIHVERTFVSICTAHPKARAALRARLLPADFTCPLGRPDCPMRRILAEGAGRSLRLTLEAIT